jgi:MFS family permease
VSEAMVSKSDCGGSPTASTYAIYMLVLLTAANVMSYADRYVFSIAMPAIKDEFQISDSLLGLIAGPGFTISYLLFTMPLAALADRWSRRKILAASITLWSAATSLCGMAATTLQLTITRIMVGVGEAGAMPPSQSMVAELFPENRRSTAMGVLASAPYLGLIVGLSGGGYLASAYGWRWAFIIMALAGIPLALLIWLTGPKRAAVHQGEQADGNPRISSLAAAKEFWNIPSLRLLAIGTGIFNIFGYAGSIWLPTLLMRSHDMSAAEAGLLLGTCSTLGGVLGSFSSGVLVDKWSRRDARWQLRLPAICFMLSFPIFVIMLSLPKGIVIPMGAVDLPVIGIFMLMGGFLSAAWMGPAFGSLARLVPAERRSQAAALLIVIINVLGSAMGPVIAGLVSDALGVRFGEDALRMSLLSMSSLTLIGGAIFLRASSHYQRDIAAAQARTA